MAGAKELYAAGQDGWGAGADVPQVRGRRLTCAPGAGQGPAPGTGMQWAVGEG